MGKKIKGYAGIVLMAVFLSLSACAPWSSKENMEEDGAQDALSVSHIPEIVSEELPEEDSEPEEEVISYYDSSYEATHSMFCWDLYLLNEGAFPELGKTLANYGIGRIYQEIPLEYLKEDALVRMVADCRDLGIEVVALEGDREWQKEGLSEYYEWLDGLLSYNEEHPKEAITGIALDVESYTYSSFKENPKEGFEEYITLMQEAYSYASDRGIRVIQVIPESLDGIDSGLYEEFLLSCCDEVSVMNYDKAGEISNIEAEVLTCRRLGIPIETIFETMPLSDYYSVTGDKTYFYDGADALQASVAAVEDYFGTSLGIGYHHLRTMYYLDTGGCFLEIYPYTKEKDEDTNRYGQVDLGDELILADDEGRLVPAWLYNPNLHHEAKEFCYLAPGVLPDRDYKVFFDSQKYHSVTEKLHIDGEEGKTGYTISFKVRPNK